jgi:phage regulator Rha-like protein
MSTYNLPVTQAPIVHSDGGRVLTNSRDVAAYFDMRHDNVLRAVASPTLAAAPAPS